MSQKISNLEHGKECGANNPLNILSGCLVYLVLTKIIEVMQSVEKFKHVMHMVNHYRAIVKSALREYRIPDKSIINVPKLDRDLDYYFIFETAPKQAENALVYGITCFDSDGVILFSHQGIYPVSLWRFRRQGLERTISTFNGIVKTLFRRKNIPLLSDEPFYPMQDGIYCLNISWTIYKSLINSPHAH